MVCSIIDNAVRLINQAFRTTILRRIINIRFAVISFGQCGVVIVWIIRIVVECIATNHHAKRCPWIKIPFLESVPSLR